ncbi:Hypothetical protein CINCED_3A018866 [Cinara cedri]|uniref:Uncharacterized protein n=1 Tax=Cinara cedri TaxID=506608 RepID=A0A5E4NGM2_9HEMI|nr:Hypothetical protein CINCED_3A018866 [Cinara cedri]
MDIPDRVLDPLSNVNTAESSQLEKQLLELTTNEEIKFKFKNSYQKFWLQKPIMELYPSLWSIVQRFLIAFPPSYLSERGFSAVAILAIELKNDSRAKIDFNNGSSLEEFWIKCQPIYPEISNEALKVLVQFSSTFLCESGFSSLVVIKTKHRHGWDVESDLRENFNLSFGRPQVDTCCKCEDLSNKIKNTFLNETAKRTAVAEMIVHKRQAKQFYTILISSRDENKQLDDFLCLTFDYMQNLQLPKIPVQDLFYFR